jgi:hypothetical protein
MRNDQLPDQSHKPKIDIISINKPYYIYYSHSIRYYNTQQEENDIKFLESNFKIINPNDLRLGKDMIQYLFKVQQCDAVWYRGNTIGVVFEVLTALAMKKPVFSLRSKDIMNYFEITDFIEIFRNNDYIEHDISLFEDNFPEYYSDFLSLLGGYML